MIGKFVPEFAPNAFNGNFLIDSDNLYIWTSLDSEGYKTPVSSREASLKNETAISGLIKFEEISCAPWQPKPDIFKLPANINFQTEDVPNSSVDKLFE